MTAKLAKYEKKPNSSKTVLIKAVPKKRRRISSGFIVVSLIKLEK